MRTWPAYNPIAEKAALAFISVFLLYVAFTPGSKNLWLPIAFAFWFFILDQPRITRLEVTMFSCTLSLAYSSLLFESILFTHFSGALLGALLSIPQVLVPSLIYHETNKRAPGAYALALMCMAWYLLEALRAQPLIARLLALDAPIASALAPSFFLKSAVVPDFLVLTLTFILAKLIAKYMRKVTWPSVTHSLLIVFLTLIFGLPPARLSADNLESATPVAVLQTAFTSLEVTAAELLGGHFNSTEHVILALIHNFSVPGTPILLPETVLRTSAGIRMVNDYTAAHSLPVMITGAISSPEDPSSTSYNSVLLIDRTGTDELYRKWQLIPSYESKLFSSGNHVATLALGDAILGILICMDGTFGSLIEQAIAAGSTHLLVVNASDYGLGYRTPSIQLHALRSLARRHSMPMSLATTNGPSGYINAKGFYNPSASAGTQLLAYAPFPAP